MDTWAVRVEWRMAVAVTVVGNPVAAHVWQGQTDSPKDSQDHCEFYRQPLKVFFKPTPSSGACLKITLKEFDFDDFSIFCLRGRHQLQHHQNQ